MQRAFATLTVLTSLTVAAPAFSTPIGIFSVTTTDKNAIVAFDVTGNVLTVGVVNSGGPGHVGAIASMISGVSFTFAGGGTLDAASLTGTADGAVDCVAGVAVCTPIPVPASSPGAAFGLPEANGGWTYVDPAGSQALGLYAGDGSLKPNSIANGNITGDTDGVKNAEHNPYLLGPVFFSMTFDGLISSITGATVYFGTRVSDNEVASGCVACPTPFLIDEVTAPEPGTLMLLGSGLALVAIRLRRRKSA